MGDVRGFIHLSSKEVEDLYGVAFIVILLEIEIDNRCSRVGIEPHDGASASRATLDSILGVGEEKCAGSKKQY